MRPTTLLTLFLCCVAVSTQAQTAIPFHVYIKPGTIYREKILQTVHTTFNLDSVPEAVRDAIQNAGAANKTIVTYMEMETHSGKKQAGGMIPIRMRVVNDTGATAAALPIGTTIYGHANSSGLPVFDSIDLKGQDEQKQAILAMIQKITGQVVLPDTALTIGSSYTQITPLVIPLGPMNMKMSIAQTYTLKTVSADTAGFEIKMKASFDGAGTDIPLTGGGDGWGHMVYDRKNNYPKDVELEMTMNVSVKQGEVNMKIVMQAGTSRHCTISPE
jgi:hypothetical protein